MAVTPLLLASVGLLGCLVVNVYAHRHHPHHDRVESTASSHWDVGSRASSTLDVGSRASSTFDVGSKASTHSDVGSRASSTLDVGSRASSHSDVGSRASPTLDVGSRASPLWNEEFPTDGRTSLEEPFGRLNQAPVNPFHLDKDKLKCMNTKHNIKGCPNYNSGNGLQGNRFLVTTFSLALVLAVSWTRWT